MVTDDIECFNDIGVLKRRTHAKLSSNLFVVLPFCLTRATWAELFDSINCAPVLGLALNEPDGTSGSGPEGSTEFTILFCDGCMSCVSKGRERAVGGSMGVGVADEGREGGMRVVGGGFGCLGL